MLVLRRLVRAAVLRLIGPGDLDQGRTVAWATETAVITLAFLFFGSLLLLVTIASTALGLALLLGDTPHAGPGNAPSVGRVTSANVTSA